MSTYLLVCLAIAVGMWLQHQIETTPDEQPDANRGERSTGEPCSCGMGYLMECGCCDAAGCFCHVDDELDDEMVARLTLARRN